VYGIGHLLPGGDLCLVPDSWDVAIAACLRGNKCCLSDQESPGNGGPLGVAGGRQSKPLNREEKICTIRPQMEVGHARRRHGIESVVP
jgi:hypothetical protein